MFIKHQKMAASYSSLLKSNIVFGGIKFLQILVTLVKTKIFAILLGASGMGIHVLLNSALQTIHQFTTFGIYKTAVRDIALSTLDKTQSKTTEVIRILHTFIILFSLLGASLCFIFSPVLSELIFNTSGYTIVFMVLSLGVIFEALSNDLITIFQGLRKVKELAKASLIGAFFSLIVIIPIIYFWRETGIVYAIVVSYFVVFLVYGFYYKKCVRININRLSTKRELLTDGGPMVKMGTLLMVSYAVYSLLTLLLNSIINYRGGIDEVGFYNAANNCTYGNIVIFTSILTSDFYPRLAALQTDREKFNIIFNQQIELLLLVLLPIICIFIVLSEQIVLLLYSDDFLIIVTYIKILAISLLYRLVWQACSMVILSHGKQKIYLIYDALIANGGFFVANVCAYYLFGMLGLCYSCILSSVLIMTILLIALKKNFSVSFSKNVIKLMITSTIIISLNYLSTELFVNSFMISFLIVLLSIGISCFYLNKRINIMAIVKQKICKWK